MMKKIERAEIIDYQNYEDTRDKFRSSVLKQKEDRRIHVGESLTFLFENHDTVKYQIQEMMRVEQIIKESAILHEIETYNELIGEAGELCCTLLIEFSEPELRDKMLKKLLNLPNYISLVLENGEEAKAQYDERQVGEDRLSAVQYLKFNTGSSFPVRIKVTHPELNVETNLSDYQKEALKQDLN